MDSTRLETKTLEAVEKAYGKSLSPPEYRFIAQDRQDEIGGLTETESAYLTECCAGLITPTFVADRLRQVFGKNSLRTKFSTDTNTDGYNRSVVTSQMIALNAKRDTDVVAFRKDVMKNQLIDIYGLAAWIKEQAKKDGKPTLFKHITRRDKKGFLRASLVMGYELQYWLSIEDRVNSVYVKWGGVLDKLRTLSNKLSIKLSWSEAQATTWILTGEFPVIEAIEVGAEIYTGETVANKVTLKIDPSSTNEEVIEAYRWARGKFFQPRETRNTTKSELLAVFYKLHEDKTRKEKLRIWNGLCNSKENWKKSWSYDPRTGINNFGRDLKTSYTNYIQDRKPKELEV